MTLMATVQELPPMNVHVTWVGLEKSAMLTANVTIAVRARLDPDAVIIARVSSFLACLIPFHMAFILIPSLHAFHFSNLFACIEECSLTVNLLSFVLAETHGYTAFYLSKLSVASQVGKMISLTTVVPKIEPGISACSAGALASPTSPN